MEINSDLKSLKTAFSYTYNCAIIVENVLFPNLSEALASKKQEIKITFLALDLVYQLNIIN